MKYLFLTLSMMTIFSTESFAKEKLIFACPVDKDISMELSLIDNKNPSIGLFFKTKKVASCLYETSPMTKLGNPRAQVDDAIWRLTLKECNYYYDDYKTKIVMTPEATFKSSKGRNEHYLLAIKGRQPSGCKGN